MYIQNSYMYGTFVRIRCRTDWVYTRLFVAHVLEATQPPVKGWPESCEDEAILCSTIQKFIQTSRDSFDKLLLTLKVLILYIR